MVATSSAIDAVIRLCKDAADANRQTETRQGNLIVLSADEADDVLVAADLHGQRLNFGQLMRCADLDGHPGRHMVTQEVCHGGPKYPSGGGCMSHLLLEDVIATKLRYPQRFHFLLSNHELAELNDHPIAKGGRMLNVLFRTGLQQMYGDAADDVRIAYRDFLATCPLAVRLTNGAFVCHSVPEDVDEVPFDVGIFQRPLRASDVRPGGDAFRLVWGRDFREQNSRAFAKLVNAQVLIQGHEPCRDGFATPNRWHVILDCCARNACYVLLPMDKPLTQDHVMQCMKRLFCDESLDHDTHPGRPPMVK